VCTESQSLASFLNAAAERTFIFTRSFGGKLVQCPGRSGHLLIWPAAPLLSSWWGSMVKDVIHNSSCKLRALILVPLLRYRQGSGPSF
jgi:hypothetical protein